MRQRITRTPQGSPEASACRVYRLNPDGTRGELLREESPFPVAKRDSSGSSIEQYVGHRWASRVDGVQEETGLPAGVGA